MSSLIYSWLHTTTLSLFHLSKPKQQQQKLELMTSNVKTLIVANLVSNIYIYEKNEQESSTITKNCNLIERDLGNINLKT
jgi:hypothetical protein